MDETLIPKNRDASITMDTAAMPREDSQVAMEQRHDAEGPPSDSAATGPMPDASKDALDGSSANHPDGSSTNHPDGSSTEKIDTMSSTLTERQIIDKLGVIPARVPFVLKKSASSAWIAISHSRNIPFRYDSNSPNAIHCIFNERDEIFSTRTLDDGTIVWVRDDSTQGQPATILTSEEIEKMKIPRTVRRYGSKSGLQFDLRSISDWAAEEENIEKAIQGLSPTKICLERKRL